MRRERHGSRRGSVDGPVIRVEYIAVADVVGYVQRSDEGEKIRQDHEQRQHSGDRIAQQSARSTAPGPADTPPKANTSEPYVATGRQLAIAARKLVLSAVAAPASSNTTSAGANHSANKRGQRAHARQIASRTAVARPAVSLPFGFSAPESNPDEHAAIDEHGRQYSESHARQEDNAQGYQAQKGCCESRGRDARSSVSRRAPGSTLRRESRRRRRLQYRGNELTDACPRPEFR